MAYEGGYTSALNSISDRDLKAIETLLRQQQLRQQATAFQQQQEQQRKQQQAKAALGNMLTQMPGMGAPPGAGGPQPPMPGQPSMPMMPPGGGGMPGMPPPPQGAAPAPMPGMPPPQGGMPPPGMPPGGMPSMPPPPAQGQGAPMAKAGGPGAPPMPGPGAPPAGAAPPAPPQGWQGLPKPPEDAPAGPGGIPPPPEDAVMPKQLISVQDLSKLLAAKGIKGEQAMDMIEQWKPFMDSQNKAQLDTMKMQNAAQAAAIKAYQESLRQSERARHNAVEEGIQRDRNAAMRTRGAAGGGGAAGPKPTWTEKTIDYYAERALAGDNSWRTGLSRTARGAANISAVDDRVASLSEERGSTPGADLSARASRTATEKALTDRTKFVATGQQFVRNFQKQADLVEKYLGPGAAGSVPVINKWIQKGRKSVEGDADVTAFDTAIRGLAREHQRIVTGVTSNAQLHASAQETADELLNKDMTADQVRATLKVMREEATNAVSSGKDEVADLQSQLKNIGAKKTDGAAREFASEEEAKAAKLAPGTKVKINGVSGTWQ